MNIHQLNQSGQNIWVFVVTAMATLALTGAAWFCIELANSYRAWEQEKSFNYKSVPNHSITSRIALVLLLVKQGRTLWLRRSGAWLCILSNEKYGRFKILAWDFKRHEQSHSGAIDYASKHLKAQDQMAFDGHNIATEP